MGAGSTHGTTTIQELKNEKRRPGSDKLLLKMVYQVLRQEQYVTEPKH
jgi:hypothetical protein